MSEWFEDEAFWAGTYPFMYPEARFEAVPNEIDGVLALTGLTGGTALDLCSGPGRHSVELAKRGFRVTGVDRTPFLREKAKARAILEGVEVEWVFSDMREFVRPESFDLAISMFTSFGYFDNQDEDLLVLGNLHENLKPGGYLVIDTMGKERFAKIFLASTSETLDDGRLIVQRHEIFDEWSRIRNEWIVIDGETVERFEFHHTIYSGRELKALILQAGFSEVRICGDLGGSEYDTDARRLVALATK